MTFAASLPTHSHPSTIDWCNMQANNPWISILKDTIRHLCVEDLRNSLLLRAISALI